MVARKVPRKRKREVWGGQSWGVWAPRGGRDRRPRATFWPPRGLRCRGFRCACGLDVNAGPGVWVAQGHSGRTPILPVVLRVDWEAPRGARDRSRRRTTVWLWSSHSFCQTACSYVERGCKVFPVVRQLAFTGHLLHVRSCSKHFTQISAITSHRSLRGGGAGDPSGGHEGEPEAGHAPGDCVTEWRPSGVPPGT